MEPFLKRTWAEIHLDRLVHNLHEIRGIMNSKTSVMAIVKADAYGHGDHAVSRTLRDEGVTHFGVSNLEEARSLRSAGIEGHILILGMTPPELASELAANRITQAVYSREYAVALADAAAAAGVCVEVHAKVDTGMGRLGFPSQAPACDEAADFLAGLHELKVTGIFSHFSHADCAASDPKAYTGLQIERFEQAAGSFRQRFPDIQTHLQNSAGIMDYRSLQYDLARPGIILYGLNPSEEMGSTLDLQPVMELKTAVSMVKEITAGTPVSYGRTFTAPHTMRIATLPIGYADGYPRLLSGKGEVLVHGRRAPVIGRVCMDQMMVDVTQIPETKMGDTVTVFGYDQKAFLPVDELADKMGTINYEIVCLIGKRVPRIYLKGGEIVGVYDSVAK